MTFETLPSLAKEAFVASQKYSFELKERRAARIITEFYDDAGNAFTPQGLAQIISKMLTR